MSNIEVTYMQVECRLGTTLPSCMAEAIILCLKEHRVVHVKHNGNTYVINPDEAVDWAMTECGAMK